MLILALERPVSNGPLDVFQDTQVFPSRMQWLACFEDINVLRLWPQAMFNCFTGNGRQLKSVPCIPRPHIAGQVFRMDPLHHQDDDTIAFAVEPRVERLTVPIVYVLPLSHREHRPRLDRIINHDHVRAPTTKRPVDPGRITSATSSRYNLGFSVFLGTDSSVRE